MKATQDRQPYTPPRLERQVAYSRITAGGWSFPFSDEVFSEDGEL